jgi:hypothetical protein
MAPPESGRRPSLMTHMHHGNHVKDVVALDVFVVPAATFRVLFGACRLGADASAASPRCSRRAQSAHLRKQGDFGLAGYGLFRRPCSRV